MATMDLRRCGATAYEFEETRPSLYFSQHTWAHLNAVRRLSRSAAANDAVKPEEPAPEPIRDFTTAAWVDDDAALAYVDLVPERAGAAALPPLPLPTAPAAQLARLAGGVALAVCALATAGFLLG